MTTRITLIRMAGPALSDGQAAPVIFLVGTGDSWATVRICDPDAAGEEERSGNRWRHLNQVARQLTATRNESDPGTKARPGTNCGQTAPFAQFNAHENDPLAISLRRNRTATLVSIATDVTGFALWPAPTRAIEPTPNTFADPLLPDPRFASKQATLRELAALRLGFSTQKFHNICLLAWQPTTGAGVSYRGFYSSGTNVPADAIARDKDTSRRFAQHHGLPVPAGVALDEKTDPVQATKRLRSPLVVKPAQGSLGTDVTLAVRDSTQLQAAIKRVREGAYAASGVIVEEQVEGNDYRVLATAEECVSVTRRIAAEVVGDGSSNIVELILAANAVRSANPRLRDFPLRPNAEMDSFLATQGHTMETVPAVNETVRLLRVANIGRGGSNIEVIEEAHPSLGELAMRVCRLLTLPLVGLDVILNDHRRDLAEQRHSIIEINSSPGMLMHPFPLYGPACDPYAVELARLLDHVPPKQSGDQLTTRLSIRGHVQQVGYRAWFLNRARDAKLTGWVRNTHDPDQVEALISGPAQAVAYMAGLALRGPAPSYPNEVITRPVTQTPPTDFRILATGP
ncbi:acylphosphatase [Natronoglycomyces albus]|uniref:acylphosphatase n=1 Tax=Natronoglycomyces albus TaxID=2811108 RepID=A0A895XP18_9ACTN|nr:acylphosphatase [Natronoglycomyces albus]QSB04815.1 acylphosphatase [Natronoglycomyces albus]